MKKVILALIILLISMTLAGCEVSHVTETKELASGITRLVDPEAGVVCWVYSGYNVGGISCLPLSETNLK